MINFPERLALAPLMRFFLAYKASRATVLAAIALRAVAEFPMAFMAVEDAATAAIAV